MTRCNSIRRIRKRLLIYAYHLKSSSQQIHSEIEAANEVILINCNRVDEGCQNSRRTVAQSCTISSVAQIHNPYLHRCIRNRAKCVVAATFGSDQTGSIVPFPLHRSPTMRRFFFESTCRRVIYRRHLIVARITESGRDFLPPHAELGEACPDREKCARDSGETAEKRGEEGRNG